MADLASITVTNGVNEQGEPFITVVAVTTEGTFVTGQVDPALCREHAMSFLACAEAAEQDAATLRCIRHLELPDELAGAIIVELRNYRGSHD